MVSFFLFLFFSFLFFSFLFFSFLFFSFIVLYFILFLTILFSNKIALLLGAGTLSYWSSSVDKKGIEQKAKDCLCSIVPHSVERIHAMAFFLDKYAFSFFLFFFFSPFSHLPLPVTWTKKSQQQPKNSSLTTLAPSKTSKNS